MDLNFNLFVLDSRLRSQDKCGSGSEKFVGSASAKKSELRLRLRSQESELFYEKASEPLLKKAPVSPEFCFRPWMADGSFHFDLNFNNFTDFGFYISTFSLLDS